MKFEEFLLLNSEIEHNVRAIVRLQMIKDKLVKQPEKSNSSLIENIDKKIQVNKELIQQYLKRSYVTIGYEDIEKNISKLVEQLVNEYDSSKSFKENYSKALSELEEINEKSEDDIVEEIDEDADKDIDEDVEEDIDEEIDEDIDEENDKMKIKYTVENDKYNIEKDGVFAEIPMKIYGYDSDKMKQIYGDDYDDIFKDVDERKIKYHDPRLVFFLWQKMGKEAANQYLKEFSKGKKADKSKLPYEMTYDMKKIKNNKNLSKKEKKLLLKIAKKNKNVAKVEQDKKKTFRRVLAGFAAGIFALGATAGLLYKKEETKTLEQGKKVEHNDTREPKKDDNILSFSDKYKLTLEDIDKELESSMNIEIEDLGIESEQAQELLKNFKIGDVLYLGEGINYSEDSMGGGRKGETGVTPWRPAGGYEINGISILDADNNIVTFSVQQKGLNVLEYIKKNLPENGRVAFHINKLQDGESRPTGWVESDRILEALSQRTIGTQEVER